MHAFLQQFDIADDFDGDCIDFDIFSVISNWDYKNPLPLDMVDRYLRRMGMKRFQSRLRRVWNRFVSYTRVYETSAGGLRSIYPSLGMR